MKTNVDISKVQPLVNRMWVYLRWKNPKGELTLEMYEMLLYGWAGNEEEFEKKVIEMEEIMAKQIAIEKNRPDPLDGCLTITEWEEKNHKTYWGKPIKD